MVLGIQEYPVKVDEQENVGHYGTAKQIESWRLTCRYEEGFTLKIFNINQNSPLSGWQLIPSVSQSDQWARNMGKKGSFAGILVWFRQTVVFFISRLPPSEGSTV